MPNYTVFIGAIILLIIYYSLGMAPLFCTVGGLIAGSFIQKIEEVDRRRKMTHVFIRVNLKE